MIYNNNCEVQIYMHQVYNVLCFVNLICIMHRRLSMTFYVIDHVYMHTAEYT